MSLDQLTFTGTLGDRMSGDPFQTYQVDGVRYRPVQGARVASAQVGFNGRPLYMVNVEGDEERLIELGLLVKVEICPATKTFVPLPGQGGDMSTLTLTCDRDAKPGHKVHRSPGGVEWHA